MGGGGGGVCMVVGIGLDVEGSWLAGDCEGSNGNGYDVEGSWGGCCGSCGSMGVP